MSSRFPLSRRRRIRRKPGVGYHDPKVENLRTGLRGIHRGLSESALPENYQGVVLYSDWEMDEGEWEAFRQEFLKGG